MNSFDGARLLIEDARALVGALSSDIVSYQQPENYEFQEEPIDEGRRLRLKIRLHKPFPVDFSLRIFHVLASLRSALDHAVFASAAMLGAGNPKAVAFPFVDKPGKVRAKVCEIYRTAPASMVALFEDFRPYEGGNKLLWALNKARNVQLHRYLIPFSVVGSSALQIDTGLEPYAVRVVTVSGSCSFFGQETVIGGVSFFTPLDNATLFHPELNEARNEIVYAECSVKDRKLAKITVTTEIAFDDVPEIRGQPVVATLQTLLSEVEKTCEAIRQCTLSLHQPTV